MLYNGSVQLTHYPRPFLQTLNKAFQMSCAVLTEEHKALGEQEQENTRIVNK